MDASFRVEFYIKTGIVLLGATLPFALIVWAGPVAILQASIVSIATFPVIFAVALLLAIIATTRWEPAESGAKPEAGEIWRRLPKFVLGFLAASLIVSFAARDYSLAEYNKLVAPGFVAPINDLRSWAFIFSFFSIGLTTRFRELAQAGVRPFAAFSAGVVVNVALGLILSAFVFASHWASLARGRAMSFFRRRSDAAAVRPRRGRCGSCVHFRNDAAYLEAATPGLTSFGSADASVRADDGLCSRYDRDASARAGCADFGAILARPKPAGSRPSSE